jgi:hypothetical protein
MGSAAPRAGTLAGVQAMVLGRPAERAPAAGPSSLLRAAQDAAANVAPGFLLRGATESERTSHASECRSANDRCPPGRQRRKKILRRRA